MSDPKPIRAAGGVLWRDGRDGPEVLLVHRPGHNDWSLPKGKSDPGEIDLQTAVREVTEETGLRFALGARLGSVTYEVKGRPKTASYWAMRLHPAQQGDPAPHDVHEIDDLAWHTIKTARKTLTYPEDAQILRTFTERGTGSASLVLLRHGLAGKRGEWSGEDTTRPLDERGRAQADAIGRTIGAFGPASLLSAPLTRCVQTAEPLASACGLTIEQSTLVADSALKHDSEKAVKRLREWATGADTIAVVSQGNLIDAALDDLLGDEPQGHARQKGSAWVFCARDGQIVAADYYPSLLPQDIG